MSKSCLSISHFFIHFHPYPRQNDALYWGLETNFFFLLLIREVSRIWLFYKESFVFWYIMVISLENSEDRILRALRFFFCFCNINVDAQIWTIFNKDRPVRDYFHFFLSRRIDAYILSLSVILCHVLSEICCFQLCGIIYELMMSSSFFQYFIWITC